MKDAPHASHVARLSAHKPLFKGIRIVKVSLPSDNLMLREEVECLFPFFYFKTDTLISSMLKSINFNKVSHLLSQALDIFQDPNADEEVNIDQGDFVAQYHLSIPGHSREDVKVTKKGDKLLVYLRRKLVKTYFMPQSVDRDNIKISVKNGVLTIDFSLAFHADEEEIIIS